MENTRLLQQMSFIMEVDKLKNIFRKTKIADGSRYENDAEHSWHLMLMTVILLEHANEPSLNLLKVMKMLLIHDIVEIDAGDTFAYDDAGHEDKMEREQMAAERLFGILPDDQRDECMALWHEFEERVTNEAKYATALDRLQPMMLNFQNKGDTWQKYGITSDRVLERNKPIDNGSEVLWDFAKGLVAEAIEKGYLEKGGGEYDG